jgi:hypothetical protein
MCRLPRRILVIHPRIEAFPRRCELRRRGFRGHQSWPEASSLRVLLAVPAEMLASDSKPRLFSMEVVQRFEVAKDDCSDFFAQE